MARETDTNMMRTGTSMSGSTTAASACPAYQELGMATSNAGPLDAKTQQLVKVGIAIAAGLEGGTHSHVRKAIEAGATAEEIRHAALLCLTTIGFPAMMKGTSWIDDVLEEEV